MIENGIINCDQLASIIVNLGIQETKNNSLYNFTHLKLQKLMYFTTIKYYQKTKTMLINSDFEKWTYGPVIRKIYEQYREFGFLEITRSKISYEDSDKLNHILKNHNIIKKIITKTFNEKAKWTLNKLIEESHTGELWIKPGGLITSKDIERVYGK